MVKSLATLCVGMALLGGAAHSDQEECAGQVHDASLRSERPTTGREIVRRNLPDEFSPSGTRGMVEQQGSAGTNNAGWDTGGSERGGSEP